MTIPVIKTKSIGQTLMKRILCASVIVENREGEVLLLLRDNKSTILYPNHWTLIGGKVEEGETPETAAHRELVEETGFFKPDEIQRLKIGHGFKTLLHEYFLSTTGSSDVHHS